ncbi:MAG: MFS transporter [Kordiimonadaceae bacterium]|jgi:MFS family permease|nr:MFS transporter [Kordiimonadaceae bacterium]MBT6035862.1 MFS transporter [Kordiimonadaceae bacterium]MBT6328187.1 MFS transporter [Kordiimonadaceae bacterium]MBT7583521.1 MFS transporter [Kordiimonadaceae bacterium]
MPKYFHGWNIVAASIFGFSASPGQFAFAALGIFTIPLGIEFGWSREEISLAATIFTLTQAFATAIIGRVVDRIGAKEVLVPSIIIFGLLLGLVPLLVSELWHLYLLFFLIGALAAGSAAVPYLRIISAWFKKNRGLAFGITMAGGGLGYMYVPPMLQYLISNHGWRYGYYALAAIVLLAALPLVAKVLKNTPHEVGLAQDGIEQQTTEITEEGEALLSLSDLIKDRVFWIIYATIGLLTFSLFGLMFHFVPMLIDRGTEEMTAALAFTYLGTTVVIARVGVGYLLDKFFAPRLAMICILLSTLGVIILSTGVSGPMTFVAAVFLGFSIGAELDLLAYLTTRYFGLGSFGMAYGVLFSAFLFGVSTGPLAYGIAYESYGSYINILGVCVAVLITAASLMFLMPKYRE